MQQWSRPSVAVTRVQASHVQATSETGPATVSLRRTISTNIVRSRAEEDPFTAALTNLRALFAPEDSGSDKLTQSASLAASRSPIKFTKIPSPAAYSSPRLPCVLLHGLFGFSTLNPVASLPQWTIDYWRGVAAELQSRGVEVLITNVKTSASIQERAQEAAQRIEERFPGREINLIGHSMGGLDARYLTSCVKDRTFKVQSVTTVATPHRGSPFASYLLYDFLGRKRLPALLNFVKTLGIPGGGEAFECLTTEEMAAFNTRVTDIEGVYYTSWGAAFQPGLFNEFRIPHSIIWNKEGHNDGLVSVDSSKWGEYRGTLNATHIDLIGWGNAIKKWSSYLGGSEPPFDCVRFYLGVCDDLARMGL
ncbi:unnamed protein product [Jaminaea pallidilutea]